MRKFKQLSQEEREATFRARYEGDGRHQVEIPDPTPVEVPAKFQVPETTEDKMRRILRAERFLELQDQMRGESIEDANDFWVGDDEEPYTPHEFIAMAAEHLEAAGYRVRTTPPKPKDGPTGDAPKGDATPPKDPPGKAAVAAPEKPQGAPPAKD